MAQGILDTIGQKGPLKNCFGPPSPCDPLMTLVCISAIPQRFRCILVKTAKIFDKEPFFQHEIAV